METVARMGGAHAPYERIMDFVGGRFPSGLHWQYIKSWRAVCRTLSLAFMQYNRDIETVGPNKGLM